MSETREARVARLVPAEFEDLEDALDAVLNLAARVVDLEDRAVVLGDEIIMGRGRCGHCNDLGAAVDLIEAEGYLDRLRCPSCRGEWIELDHRTFLQVKAPHASKE